MSSTPQIPRQIDRDSLPHYIRIALQLLQERFSTILCRLACRWWGIKLGANCSFVGRVRFARCRASSIEIGDDGRFLSSVASNLHGLDRPCMLTTLTPGAALILGRDVGMSGTVVCCATRVVIGDRVMLGANSTITDTDSHPIDYRMRYPKVYGEAPAAVVTKVCSAPVIIEDDVFIGMNTLILKGVTIGRGTVVGAGSVVTRSLPAYCIAAGNPARPLKFLDVPGAQASKTLLVT